jgi:hypothetical protein
MLYRIWKFCSKRKWLNLANAIAYYHASQFCWKMLPGLTPPGVTKDRFKSFVRGYLSDWSLGWISEIDNPFLDSDPNLENWDITFNLIPETEVILRSKKW